MSSTASSRQAGHRILRQAPNFRPGDTVLSTYARRWKGTVLEVIDRRDSQAGDYRLLKVRQEIDHCGNPIVKGLRKVVQYNVYFFRFVSPEETGAKGWAQK